MLLGKANKNSARTFYIKLAVYQCTSAPEHYKPEKIEGSEYSLDLSVYLILSSRKSAALIEEDNYEAN